MKYPFIKQLSNHDCGVAVLRMIYQFYNKEVELSNLISELNTTNSELSLLDIKNNLEYHEISSEGRQYQLSKIEDIDFPAILHYKADNKSHFVLLYGKKKDRYIIADPGDLKIKYVLESELEKFDGNTLVLLTEREKKKKLSVDFLKYRVTFLFIAFLELILIYFIADSFGNIVEHFENKNLYSSTLLIIFSYILFQVVSHILVYVKIKLNLLLSKKLDKEVISNNLSSIINAPKKFFMYYNESNILTLINDAKIVKQYKCNYVINIVTDIFLALSLATFSLYYFGIIGLLFLAMILVIGFVTIIIKKKYRKASEKYKELDIENQKETLNYLLNARYLSRNGYQHFFSKKVTSANDSFYKCEQNLQSIKSNYRFLLIVFRLLFISSALIYCFVFNQPLALFFVISTIFEMFYTVFERLMISYLDFEFFHLSNSRQQMLNVRKEDDSLDEKIKNVTLMLENGNHKQELTVSKSMILTRQSNLFNKLLLGENVVFIQNKPIDKYKFYISDSPCFYKQSIPTNLFKENGINVMENETLRYFGLNSQDKDFVLNDETKSIIEIARASNFPVAFIKMPITLSTNFQFKIRSFIEKSKHTLYLVFLE